MANEIMFFESPNKVKTLNKKMSGDGFTFFATRGHFIDLPKNELGVEVTTARKMQAELAACSSPEREKILRGRLAGAVSGNPDAPLVYFSLVPMSADNHKQMELWKKACRGKTVYLATDDDREGEVIAWNLQRILKPLAQDIIRIRINAIERDAILHSVQEVKNARAKGDKNAGKIDEGLVKAGNIRRLLDRIFGYGLSGPVAERLGLRWGESAVGRTQTGGMALIEQREKEIQNFVPSPYWVVVYKDKDGTEFRSQPIKDEKEAEKIRSLFAAKAVCSKYEEKKIQEQRKPALTLSTAMGLGIKILKLSSAEVTSVLQNLFEDGLTTYPRTDLEQKFPETEDMIRKYMSGAYPDLYMPTTEKEKASWQKKITDGKSQGAHECIHPTKMDAAHAPDKISGLSANGHAMYDLIWKATAASAARPAEYSVKNVELASDGTEMVLKAAGSIMTFPGWRAIAGNIFGKKEDKEIRGTYARGKAVSGTVSLDRKMTTPPERFDEKTFLERLEKEEIGRPSTFSEIVSKQTLRGHSKKDGKGKFFMQPLGEKQMELLHKTCAELADPKYTARMEEMLDLVSNGKIDWKEPVAEAWTLVEKYVANLERAGTAFRLPDSVIETIRNSASRRGSGSWGNKKAQGGGKKTWSKTPGKGTGRTR